MITINDFLEMSTLEGLTAAFFNFSINNGHFEISSSYRFSKFADIELTNDIYSQNNRLLSEWTNLSFSLSGKKHVFLISSDDKVATSVDFAEAVYRKIQQKRLEHYSDEQFERVLLLSLIGLRGSADPTTNFYAVDIIRDIQTDKYLDLIFRLLTNISDIRQLNLNFRELQQQYYTEENQRNTQIRINLRWLSEKLNYNLSEVNIYKDSILKKLKKTIRQKNMREITENGFIERLIIYRNNILNVNNNSKVHDLRRELGFTLCKNDSEIRRSTTIINIARELYDDECVCCKDIYPIENRTFKIRSSGRYYLEIHHVISFSSDKKGDQIDNLVKVCPACHRALTKNRGEEKYQKELIENILKNSNSAQQYVSNFLDSPTLMDMINYVYEKLQ